MKLKKLSLLLLSAMLVPSAFAANTATYSKITQIKSWGTKIDIYLEEDHACVNSVHRKRYVLSPEVTHSYKLLLAAKLSGSGVQLAYSCTGESGQEIAHISGVRMK